MGHKSSITTELAWLGFFLLVFAAAVYLFVGLLVPHHFNDKVAIMLAAILAGLVMIFTRARITRRAQRR
jgi:membrane protein implicated in regulation of membrane protease activity